MNMPIATFFMTAIFLTACGGGGSSPTPPFNLYEGVATADLNNDGRIDIVVCYRRISGPPPHPGFVSVFLQNPANPGSFLAPVTYAVGNDPWALHIADMNADLAPDILVTNTESYTVSVLYQQVGTPGTFRNAVHFATTIKPAGLTIHDINADSWPDIAVAGYGGTTAPQNGAAILLHHPTNSESIQSPVVINTGVTTESIRVADLNNDGMSDLVVDGDSDIRILLQNPASPMSFAAPVSLTAGVRPAFVALADFDRDNHLDILVANAGSSADGSGASVSFLRQDPMQSGQFLAPVQFTTANGARTFVIRDLDGDNFPDLAVATVVLQAQAPGTVSVFLQNSASPGTVNPRTDFAAGFTPYFIDAADLNNDSHIDLVVTDNPVILFQNPLQTGSFNAPVTLVP